MSKKKKIDLRELAQLKAKEKIKKKKVQEKDKETKKDSVL
ncbi:MAG: hypothetical protein HeimC3_05040 [Candidatus Heimdallarchaeota archaeon LC_3]|nr:MAG: hypothetical protein HeimC3_05040 [Candidatus Heimdallarchaeota archaeon LC_3]